MLVFIIYKDKIITSDNDNFLTDLNYNVIIKNKSKSSVYFRGKPDLFSCKIYNNEKVHYVTMEISLAPNYFEIRVPYAPYYDIETEIEANKTKTFKVRGDVNNKNYYYEADKKQGITESRYPELCSDIHLLFFFTRNPYKLDAYPEYIETMKKKGYAVLGKRVKNDFYFTISDNEMQVNDDAINDLLLFIHKYLYLKNSNNRFLRNIILPEKTRVTVTKFKEMR